jgi:hypothetical protein
LRSTCCFSDQARTAGAIGPLNLDSAFSIFNRHCPFRASHRAFYIGLLQTRYGICPGGVAGRSSSKRRASFGDETMSHKHDEQWGLCKDCKWYQIEPDANLANTTMGLCIDEELQPYRLRVSGNSGCNRFMAGKPARAEGSGVAPPTAEPVR